MECCRKDIRAVVLSENGMKKDCLLKETKKIIVDMINGGIEMPTTVIQPSLEEVKLLIEDALYCFYKNDFSLINYKTEDKAVAERCMVFRIGWYIQNYMNREEKWSLFDLDAEYNRCFNHPKSMYRQTLNGIKKKLGDAVPDLLIHKRRKNNNNIVVFEFKKNGSYEKKGKNSDYKKLKYFTDSTNEYKYKYGLWIVLYKTKKADIHIFIDGKERSDKKYTWEYKEN